MKGRLNGLFVMTVLALLIIHTVPTPTDAADSPEITINMPYCPMRINSSTGNPAMVGGIYHNLSFYVGRGFTTVNVTISHKEPDGSFSFLYESGEWTPPTNYSNLLREGACSVENTSIHFVLGLPANIITGDWDLTVHVDGTTFYTGKITLEVPYPHFSMSTPDFVFRVDPFTQEILYPTVDTYRVRITNSGNVPLEIHPAFEAFEEMFQITNATGLFCPQEQRYLDLSFTVPAWSPRIIKTYGSVLGTPLFVIPMEEGTVGINSTFKHSFNVEIDIVRQGYELIDLGDVTIQYKKTVYSEFHRDIYLDLFFTGAKNITLDIETESITLKEIALENETVQKPVHISLTSTTEKHIRLLLNTTSPQITAMVNYYLTADDMSISKNFHTEVVVGPRPVGSYDPGLILNMVGLLIFLVFLAFILGYSVIIYRRNRKKQELEKMSNEKAITRLRKNAQKRTAVKRYKSPHGSGKRGKNRR